VDSGVGRYVTQGSENAVAVSASSLEYRDKIKTVVENGVLKIFIEESINGWNWHWGWHDRKLRAYVSIKTLDEIKAHGGSDVYAKEGLTGNNLLLTFSGGSDFYGKVSVTDLDIHQSGGSDVHISGTAASLKVRASGGGDFKGYELTAEKAVIVTSGGSDAQVTASKELSVKATGGSDIRYRGGAVIKDISSSGGGSVSRRD